MVAIRGKRPGADIAEMKQMDPKRTYPSPRRFKGVKRKMTIALRAATYNLGSRYSIQTRTDEE